MSFLDVHGVPAEHGYEYRNGWLGTAEQAQSAQSVYRFSTSSHAGLGDQLPARIRDALQRLLSVVERALERAILRADDVEAILGTVDFGRGRRPRVIQRGCLRNFSAERAREPLSG